jgi:hypothetical protein
VVLHHLLRRRRQYTGSSDQQDIERFGVEIIANEITFVSNRPLRGW